MEVTEERTKSPTPSQERMLLNEDAASSTSTASAPIVASPKDIIRPATSTDLQKLFSSNANSGNGEITVALQTGTVIVTKPQRDRLRPRSKAKRTGAKRKSGSRVNPHERIKNAGVLDTPSKRSR